MNLLKSIVLISAGGFLSACVAMSQPQTQLKPQSQLQPKIQTESFQIINKHQNGSDNYHSASDMQLQTVIIKNWPFISRPSKNSEIKNGRDFKPDGPTTWLHISDKENKIDYWLFETFQAKDYFHSWQVDFGINSFLITNKEKQIENQVGFDQSLPVKLSNQPECYLGWFKRIALKQPSPHIADDVADFKSQIAIYCNSL